LVEKIVKECFEDPKDKGKTSFKGMNFMKGDTYIFLGVLGLSRAVFKEVQTTLMT